MMYAAIDELMFASDGAGKALREYRTGGEQMHRKAITDLRPSTSLQ